MAIAVVIPGQFGESISSTRISSTQIYVRRRLTVVVSLAAIVLVLFLSAGHVVANRGGAPASASMIRPATAAVASNVYVVQPGDTLWSIGERFHGHAALVDYVDSLVEANGGAEIQVSQALALP